MLLRTRVTIIVSITYALMVAGLTFAGLKSEQLADQRYAEATLNGQEIFWRKLVENTLQRIQTAAPAFAGRPDLVAAVAHHNPAAVREAMVPVRDVLTAHADVAHWEVVGGDGDLLFSSSGSLLDPPLADAGTVRLIAESGKLREGIIQGADRAFTAAVTVPLKDAAGTVVGVVTLAADLRPPLAEFKASTSSDIFLLDRSARVSMGTDPQLERLFSGALSVSKSRMETLKDGNRYYSLVVLPLHDGDGRVIGALATVRDFTRTQERQNFIRKAALSSVGAFFALVLLGFYVYLRRSFRPLNEAIQVLNALSRGDTSVRLEVRNDRDEIGRIAGTVGVFRDNAVKIDMLEQRRQRQRRRQELFIRLQMQKLSEMLEAEARAAVVADLAEIEAISVRGSDVGSGAGDRGEIEVLAKAFQTMSDRIREQHDHLQALIAERTRDVEILKEALRTRDQLAALRQELDFARELQLSSLPQVFPPFPDRTEFQIHAAMVPAKEVGGDFYDFFLIDRNHLGFVIGDASGKGVPAAMFIAITRSLVKSVAPLSASPSECLAFVNTMLSADNPQLLFATAFYAVLDIRNGEVAFCNAGHPPPLILRANGKIEAIRDVSGVALGVMEDLDYETGHFHVGPGDSVLLYTDGVTEATDAANGLFEEDRLFRVLGSLSGLDPEEVIAHVQRAVEGFVGDAPQFDDITMLALRFVRRGVDDGSIPSDTRRLMLTGFSAKDAPAPAATPDAAPVLAVVQAPAPDHRPPAPSLSVSVGPRVIPPPVIQLRPVVRPAPPPAPPPVPSAEVTIVNDLAELQRLAERVDDFVSRHGLPERMAFNLNLCLDELITNIVSYGYADDGRHEILVRLRIENGALVTTIVDDAKPYDPFTEAPEPDLEAGVDERQVGGLGVFLVKEFNDLCEYRREGDRNVVTMTKTIEKET